MKIHSPFACVVLLVLAGVSLTAQSRMDRLADAAKLSEHGQFRQAAERIAPLLEPETHSGTDAITGMAWNVEGDALQNLGDLEGARRSYETSLNILRKIPDQDGALAAAMDNLGSLKSETGELEESRALRMHARDLYKSISDHAGTARMLTNLAMVAMSEGDRKQARSFVAESFREESLVKEPAGRDLAEMYSVKALEDDRERDLGSALGSVNRAIELWAEHYGSQYYMLATAYSMRGALEREAHRYADAVADLQHSLEVLTHNGFENSKLYFLIESSYAKALRDAGMRNDAQRINSAAQAGLKSLQQGCGRCSVSIESFR